MDLLEHFKKLRKSQLQEYYLRWFPKEEMISSRDKLVDRLASVMSDPYHLREQFDRLSKSAQDFVVALLTQPDYRGTLNKILQVPRAKTIERYEIENLVRNLKSEGWVIPTTEANNGVRSEVFVLPRQVGEGLCVTVNIECREAQAMLSLEAFLQTKASKTRHERPQVALSELTHPDAIDTRIGQLQDPKLRKAVVTALERYGGILPLANWHSQGHAATHCWRDELEARLLGTTGVLSLKNYGIDLEEECLVIFQELVCARALESVASRKVENDKEYSIGVDLLIDIRRLLELARTEAIEVTREGTVFKKTEERINECLLTSQFGALFESSPVNHIIQLGKRLKLLNQDDNHLRADRVRRKIWAKKSIPTMLRTVFDLYQNECKGHRWSFHQSIVRDEFLALLMKQPMGDWVLSKPLQTTVVAQFLSSLEKQKIADTLRELQQEESQHGIFVVPLERLSQDLAYWIAHRLALAGLVDLGFQEGNFHSVRISSLGRRYFKLESSDSGDGQLVVNPDFEILLFPGGKDEAENNYVVGSFADRTSTEWVKRYRVTPESVKRGVISGLSTEDILTFLEDKCRTPIPANVKYSIREWAEGVEPILKQRVLLLRARSKNGVTQLSKLLQAHKITHEQIGDKAVIIRGARNEKSILTIQDTLRDAGLFLE